MENNVFSQWRAYRRRRAESATPAEVEKVASLRNDKTHADEAVLIVKVLLYLTAAFCAWASYFYYRDYLSESFSPAFVAVFSVALPIVVELLKVKVSHNVVRSIFFGWFFKNAWSLGFWAFLGIIAGGAYWWSVTISTDGMEKYTEMKADENLASDSLSAFIGAATADCDAQIAAAQQNYNEAVSTKWKGTTTVEAQKTAKAAARSIDKLQAQRAEIVSAATKDFERRDGRRTGKINAWAAFVNKFGGYMEVASGLCILALGFFERRLYNLHLQAETETPAPQPAPEPAPAPPSPTPQPGGRRYEYANGAQYSAAPPSTPHNGATTYNSAFNIQPHGSFFDTVARSPQTVARSNGAEVSTDADTVLKYAKTRLQSNVANFDDRQRRKSTTAANCQAIINEVARKARGRGFEPTPEVAADFHHYVKTVFDEMETNGYPYEYRRQFLEDLEQYLPAAEAA